MKIKLITCFFLPGGLLLLVNAHLFAATFTWDGSTADWTSAAHWGGALPINGSTGIIASGVAQINYPNMSLYGDPDTAPAEIRIATGGTIQQAFVYNTSVWPTNNHNFVLDGGTLALAPGWYSVTCSQDIRVRSASLFTYGDNFYMNNNFKDYDATHTGPVTVNGSASHPAYLAVANTNFTGGWIVSNFGYLVGMANNAFGSGDIIVGSAGTLGVNGVWPVLWPTINYTNLPNVTIQSGGRLSFTYVGGDFDCSPGKKVTLLDGGTLATDGGYSAVQIFFPLLVSGNVTNTANGAVHFRHDITNAVPAKITFSGGNLYMEKNNNLYTGDWAIAAGTAHAQADSSFGTGAINLQSGTTLTPGNTVTLHNVITGVGTVATASQTLLLGPWYTNSILTPAGIMPGTNGGVGIGTLNVTGAGGLAFTNLPNYDGNGSTAYSKLTIKVQDDPLHPGFPTNDLIAASGNVSGIANVDLVVDASTLKFAVLNLAPVRTILTATNDFTGQKFHSVTVRHSAQGVMSYQAGVIRVTFKQAGSLFLIQ